VKAPAAKAAKKAAKPKSAPAAAAPPSGRWLLKSEPDVFSWDMLVAKEDAGESWDGVRNYLARNNMRAMKLGDLGFFYHSNEGKEVVGICEIIALAHPDPTDGTGQWECVTVKAVAPLLRPVRLADVKANDRLSKMSLVTSMRLSVQPVTREEWDEVCRMGGLGKSSAKAKA